MAVIVTGGTGKTSLKLAPMLAQAGIPHVVTSRRGADGFPAASKDVAVKFDWLDASTYDAPFQALKEPVKAIYLVAPELAEPSPAMIAFVNLAYAKYGVKRYVLLGGGSIVPNGRYTGRLFQHLLDLGVQSCVIKASWFMENFLEKSSGFLDTIMNEGKIYSCTQDAGSYLVSASDIAAVAFRALTDPIPPPGTHQTLGPEPLSYTEVAQSFSKVLSRKVEHVKLTPEARQKQILAQGLPEHFAALFVFLETKTSQGSEERHGLPKDDVERTTGRAPQKFEDWVRENVAAFQ